MCSFSCLNASQSPLINIVISQNGANATQYRKHFIYIDFIDWCASYEGYRSQVHRHSLTSSRTTCSTHIFNIKVSIPSTHLKYIDKINFNVQPVLDADSFGLSMVFFSVACALSTSHQMSILLVLQRVSDSALFSLPISLSPHLLVTFSIF